MTAPVSAIASTCGSADFGLLSVSALEHGTISGVLQFDGNDDFTHFGSPVAHLAVLP